MTAKSGLRRGFFVASAVASLLVAPGVSVFAAPSTGIEIERLAQQVERAESLRAVKKLSVVYAQYAQAGLWREMASLFASNGELVHGDSRAKGPEAVYRQIRTIYGKGRDGLPDGAFNTRMITGPVVVLSPDGTTATSRFNDFGIDGRFGGDATWSGGIQENKYVKEGGVWKIGSLNYHPQFAGSYETGWNSLKPDSPPIPYSFDPRAAGQPLSASPVYPQVTPTPPARQAARLGELERRIAAMVDEDKVLNLQSAYGYYLDRKMWDDVADLFTADAMIEDAEIGVYSGASGVRRWLATMGPNGQRRGEANDRPQFDTVVTIEPSGVEARTRGIQMTQLGSVDTGEASMGFQVLEGRFVKQGGVWRIREMRTFPVVNTDYYQGFHKSRLAAPVPPANARPDRPSADARAVKAGGAVADFYFANPVTGRPVSYPPGVQVVGRSRLSSVVSLAPTPPPRGSLDARLAEAYRGLNVALAYSGSENVTNAFSYWLDDFRWDYTSALFHAKGWRGKYMVGFYEGPDHVLKAETAMYGNTPSPRTSVSLHYRLQPVITINEDGSQTKVRTRLFLIGHRWGGAPGSFGAGMYPNDGAILDNGVWKLTAAAIDEPYLASAGYKDGWARPRPPAPVDPNAPPMGTTGIFKRMTDVIKPDRPIATMPIRQQGFVPGNLIVWPDIKPMWFHYKNPVSGREPPYYCPDIHTCEAELQAKKAGRAPN